MERRTPRMKGPSGIEPKYYVYEEQRIGVFPYFVYEVCLYKYWKNGFCMLGSKFYKSSKLLDIKKQREYKRFKEYMIEREITLVAAPYDFIRENDLPEYEPIIKVKKSRKK